MPGVLYDDIVIDYSNYFRFISLYKLILSLFTSVPCTSN